MHLVGNTILITGGTSGIGRALAESFHQLGNQVIIVGRRQHLLDEITNAHPGMRGKRLDVEDASAIDTFTAEIEREVPELNVLINNAGMSRTESLTVEHIDVSVSRSIVQTNILGTIEMTAALLPVLKRQEHAAIVTTSSGLAFVPRANFPTYCASKAFLHSWVQSLRFQLRKTSVEVLELTPPYVQTELAGPAQATDPNAMPLADYIAEVMELLAEQTPPHGEVLVEEVKALRWAERNGAYEKTYALLNGE